jgi:hypothetical protein
MKGSQLVKRKPKLTFENRPPVAKKAKVENIKAKEKKARAEEGNEFPAPAEVGGVWPYRRGSIYRWMFQTCWEGGKLEFIKLQAEFPFRYKGAKPFVNWKNLLRAFRRREHRTHDWSLNEEGGRLKIYNVKYHPKTTPKRFQQKAKKEAPAKKKAAAPVPVAKKSLF